VRYIFLKTIYLYKKIVSPILRYLAPNCGCRFFPTCSEYGYQAIEKYGVIIGAWKTLKRIIRCHPFSKGGYDPI
jgi:putative membrane protein insertion efficiency factor